MNRIRKKFVIIGAGLAGLTCAKLLSERMEVTVLERSSVAGGLASGIKENGFSMDVGPHYMVLPRESHITDEVRQILGDGNLLDFPNFAESHKAFFEGEILESFPSVKKFILKRGKMFAMRVMAELFFLKLKGAASKKRAHTGSEYLRNNYGESLYNGWFRPYYSNIVKSEDDIPRDFAEDQFPPPGIRRVLSVFLGGSKRTESSRGEFFDCYPKYGMRDFIEKLERRAVDNGAEIVLDASIQDITHGGPKKITYQKSDRTHEIDADGIVYAIPLSLASRWFGGAPDTARAGPSDSAYNSIMAYLFVDSENLFDGWIINVFDPGFAISRISQQSYLSAHVAPAGNSILTAEIKCEPSDKMWDLDDEKILRIVLEDLKRMRLVSADQIFGHRIIRVPRTQLKPGRERSDEQRLAEFVNSYKDEYALGHESGDELAVGESGSVKNRIGGMLVAMSGAHALAGRILTSLEEPPESRPH